MNAQKYQQRHYTLRFVTPAFLGNAEQAAQWRTPPIKALLRQWWRVAYATQRGFKVDVPTMLHDEGILFGHAWLKNDLIEREAGRVDKITARKSEIRLRLTAPASSAAAKTGWPLGTQSGVAPMPANLDTSYAWFGLVRRGDGQPDRNAIKAIPPEGEQTLTLGVPEQHDAQFTEIVTLASAFGTLGSRSRGGWGSLHVCGVRPLGAADAARYARPVQTCLTDDWAMSLASDERGICVWHSKETFNAWDKAMAHIAVMRRYTRTQLDKRLRPALGFASPGRMPSPLHWKVVPSEESLRVRIFAMPHAIPSEGGITLTQAELQAAWKAVRADLDSARNLIRWNKEDAQ